MKIKGKRTKARVRSAKTADYALAHFECARDVLFTLGGDLSIRAASPSVERILGFRPEELVRGRKRPDGLVSAEQGAGLRRLMRAALAGKDTGPVVCQVRTRDGSSRMMEFTAGIPAGEGSPVTLAVCARDITEWQMLTETVRQSERKYRALVEATDTGYAILDARGLVRDANREYVRLTGRKSLASILGKEAAEWTAPHDRERGRVEIAKCLHRGTVHMLELDFLHPDGTLLPVEINAAAVEAEAGREIVSMVRDISRRREVEAALRESERQLRNLVQNQGEGIGIVDQAERFVFANPAAEQIFGTGPGGLIGRSLKEFTVPEQYAEAVRQTGLRRKRVESTYELGIVRRDGRERRILVTATPQQDSQGRFTGTFGIFRDITDRNRAEEALRASEQRYRAVVETSLDAIIISDLEGKVVAANQRAADMHGLPDPSRLMGMDVLGFIVPQDRARAAENSRRVLTEAPVERVEYRMVRHDGSVFDGELSASVLPGADGRPAGFVAVVRDVTERKRAERALRESEERLRFLGDNMPGIFFYQVDTGEDGGSRKFTYVSDGVARLHETTVGAALEDPEQVYGTVCDEHRELLAERERAAIEAMAPFNAEVRLDLPSGGTRWMQYISIPQREPGGRLWNGIGIDVTERKRAEQALRESEERYRRFFEEDLTGDYLSTPEGKIIECNKAFAEMMGFGSVEEALAADPREFYFEPDDRAAFLGRLQKERILRSLEIRLKRRDGRPVTVIENVIGIYDGRGRLESFRGYMFDITERKLAEQSLRESEEKYRALFDQASDGIMLMAVDGTSVAYNESFARMHGYQSPEEMAGISLDDLDAPGTAKLSRERLERMMAGESLRFEVEHMHREGHTFFLQVSCSVVHIGDQAYFLGFHRDITERKRLEKEVLEVGDRVQYHIGHDLHDGINQLLTSSSLRIGALRQKLREGRLPDEEELEAVAELNRQTMEQVSGLARGLSPLSIKSGGLALGLAELCKSTTALGVECRCSIDEGVAVRDLAKATHLYRIAQEAVSNALKHAGAGHIEVSLSRARGGAVLAVRDDGRGMPKGRAESKGMGLNIMKYRAGMIGAELEVASDRGRGTEVKCRFPIRGGK